VILAEPSNQLLLFSYTYLLVRNQPEEPGTILTGTGKKYKNCVTIVRQISFHSSKYRPGFQRVGSSLPSRPFETQNDTLQTCRWVYSQDGDSQFSSLTRNLSVGSYRWRLVILTPTNNKSTLRPGSCFFPFPLRTVSDFSSILLAVFLDSGSFWFRFHHASTLRLLYSGNSW